MYEKTSKLSTRRVRKQKTNSRIEDDSPEHAQGFVALKDCNNKKLYLHDLFDSWEDYSTTQLVQRSTDGRTMTRTSRSRQPRIHTAALQSGYCAICHLHYNSLEEHIQSKKHLKLIGDDANFISLNGFLDQDTSLGTFLDFNDITIGLDEKLVDCDYSPNVKRSKMPRTRATSLSRKVKQAPPSPTRSEKGHHLRSRKQINYASPATEDDSLPEMPEKVVHERPRRHNNYANSIIEEDSLTEEPERDNRELRSSTRLLAKLIDQENEEVWNSGRPKRSCNRQKRVSADERLVSDNKSYYKVEVLSSKLRSSGNNLKDNETSRKRSRSPSNSNQKSEEKSLIVKFKKLRNSELTRLNNEAENFLFPKKEGDSSSDEDGDEDGTITTMSTEKNDSSSLASEFDEPRSPKFRTEDEASMDSSCSDAKLKKRRRTHAEAFIMDNQKYYKFETPGSRLRYQGSFMPPIIKIKSPKHNGDCSFISEKPEVLEIEAPENKPTQMNLDDYQFSFEKPPRNEPWYQTFERQDNADERYMYFNDEAFWNPFILPYQMGPLPPIDPKLCVSEYQQVKKYLLEPPSSSTSGGTTPDPSVNTSAAVHSEAEEEEDNRTSINSGGETEQKKKEVSKVGVKKNPRKSPRQHASTLAILSSLIHQRKRRQKNIESVPKTVLSPIPEEQSVLSPIPEEQGQSSQVANKDGGPEDSTRLEEGILGEKQSDMTENNPSSSIEIKDNPISPPRQAKKKPGRRPRPRIDYKALAKTINDELTSLDSILDDIQIDDMGDEVIFNAKTNVLEVLETFDVSKPCLDLKGTRKFLIGVTGKKPGRKKRTNKTGWPNRIRRMMRRREDQPTKDDLDDSTQDSVSVTADSEDIDFCDDTNSTDSINKKTNTNTTINSIKENSVNDSSEDKKNILHDVGISECSRVNAKSEKSENIQHDGVENLSENTVSSNNNNNKTVGKKTLKILQPFVRVQQLNRDQINNKLSKVQSRCTPKRTNRHRRRMPASPRSPRMLRKPRGRWYKER